MSDSEERISKTIPKSKDLSKFEFKGVSNAFTTQRQFLETHLEKLEKMKSQLESVKK